MNKSIALPMVFAFLTAPVALLHAQETATSSGAPDSIVQLTAESNGLAEVPPETLPTPGTFWIVTADGVSAPYPFLPLDDQSAPVFTITSNVFLVDVTGGQVDLQGLGATSTADALTMLAGQVEKVIAQTQTAAASQPVTSMTADRLASSQALDLSGGDLTPAFSFSTDTLWLQITGVTNGIANLILNNATDEVYEVLSKTDLTATNWNIEAGEVWPTNATAMPFTLPVLDRTNALFIWAMDWTGITENGNMVPDWWFWKFFGMLGLSDTNLDCQGNTLLSDYQNDVDPNIIQCSLQFTNTYLNSMAAYGSLTVSGGTPSYEAILVNDTNTAGAVWEPYTGTNLTVSLTAGDGVYNVQVGLRGLPADAAQTWLGTRLILDTIPPVLTVTNPATSTVGQPMIQLQGYANEALGRLTFDVSNAAGIFTNQTGYTADGFYDTNLLAFTTDYFQCYDLRFTNGLNTVTLQATDLAGNTTVANVSFILDYSSVTNPPVVALIWPQDGAQIAGTNFTLQAQVDDATANVTVSITDSNGNTAVVSALVERDGMIWANDLPLAAGTNLITLTATNAAGLGSATNFSVVENDLGLTVNPLTADQLNQPYVTVTGTIGDSSDIVTVNGVQATMFGDPAWEADNVPVSSIKAAGLDVEVSDGGNNPLAGIKVNQVQPPTVVPMSYESSYHLTENGVNEGSGYDDASFYWSYVSGGNQYGHSVLWNAGEDDHNTTWNYPVPAGLGAFPTAGVNFVAQNGAMTQTYNNVIYYISYLFGAYGTYGYQAQTKLMIQPSGAQSAGGTALYLVETSAMKYTNVNDAANFNGGEVPVPPEALAVNGQGLVNSGVSNTDGSVSGLALISAPAGAPVNLTTTGPAGLYSFTNQVQAVGLKIIDANTGADLTLQTNTVIVGQQMNLTCRLSLTNALLADSLLSNFQWTVPGQTVKNYQQIFISATNTFSIKENLTNTDYTVNPISFYWIDGGTNLEVDCAATVLGAQVKAKAYFTINRPIGILTTITTTNVPPVNFATDTNGPIALQYGASANNSGQAGIFFIFGASTPTNGAGAIGLVQIINSTTRRWILDDTNSTAQKSIGTNLLDTGPDGPVVLATLPMDANESDGYTYPDSPGQGFYQVVNGVRQNFKWTSASDAFTDYLVYRPAGETNSTIWVTLCKVNWSWSGAATKGTNGVWTLDSGYPAPPVNPIGSNSIELPAWNGTPFSLQTVPDN